MAKFAIVFDRLEYDQFVALIPRDPNLPPTYIQWLTRRAEERVIEHSSRQQVLEVRVSLLEFNTYCRAQGVAPSYDALIGAAAKKSGVD